MRWPAEDSGGDDTSADPTTDPSATGAILNDDRLTLTFEFESGEDKATRNEVISSVLATVDFRELTE